MATEASQPTQPATQQVLDPRRLGRNHSGLNEKDVADVLAILHPASSGAIKIVEDMAATRRQHVLFRNAYDSFDDLQELEEQETIIINEPNEHSNSSGVGADLALRMSSQLKNPSLGFIFGRNSGTSDVVFGQDSGKRISNQHFRIYLNDNAILMLEDMSTNGTLVDDTLLKNRDRDGRFGRSRMLTSGSIICIQNANDHEVIKFIVRIPSRVSHLEQYEENLRAFLTKCATDPEQLRAVQRLGKKRSGPTMHWDGGVRYNIIGLLGQGAFATVHQLATKIDGSLLAAKELEKRRFMKNGQLDKKIDNEMRIMQDLRHPNIVQFVEYHDQGDFLYIIMEYVRHGDLQGYLNQHRDGRMPEEDVRLMAQQILSALSYLHQMKVTHRDIKPDNILIADTEPLKVKLSDFGLSKVVKQDETFLKTFCGTLLYCAPEVFPDFDEKLARGTKRRRGTKQQFHSYSSSVDIWSFAAVLWYALCGKPPFKGIADATGEAMYKNVMTTRLDPSPLREAKVSENCIDLLCRMLQTDPSMRPTDRQCLNHPWLREGAIIPEDPTLQSIIEEDESEDVGEQLSQLNFGEGQLDQEEELHKDLLEDEEFEKLVSERQSKKIRIDPLFPRNQIRDRDNDSSADPSIRSGRFDGAGEAEESFQVGIQHPPSRLFGEIGQSALESSGILSAHANEALSHESSGGEVLPDDFLPDQVAITSKNGLGKQLDTPNKQPVMQLMNETFSSPSLLGAESMVRELNMAEPHSPTSGAHSPAEPATPKTPDVPQHKSLNNHGSQPSQVSEPTPKAKPPTLDRQISLPKTASFYYDPYDPSTHNLEYASKVSGFDFVGEAKAARAGDATLPDTIRISTDAGSTDTAGLSASDVVPALPIDVGIKPPPRRLGKLTATADSFAPGLTLMIDHHSTSWGRLQENTLVYENSHDTRVPKKAFNLFWYSSNLKSSAIKELSQQGKDWTGVDDLHVGIFTCARSGISINGKLLRQQDDKGRALFGNLHSGDIVQVFQDAHGIECLKFKCEFYHGSGRAARSPGEFFDILIGKKIGLPESS